jgi:ATP-binding cassette subfamily B protein
MKDRGHVTRAFLADAPILILDEATSSLDSESEGAMERLMVNRTALVIAHRLSTVRALDRILVFANGRIVEDGAHDALLRTDDGHYRRLFERQAGTAAPAIVA